MIPVLDIPIGLKRQPIPLILEISYLLADILTEYLLKHSWERDRIFRTFEYLAVSAGRRFLQHREVPNLILEALNVDCLGMRPEVGTIEFRKSGLAVSSSRVMLFLRKENLAVHQQMWGRKHHSLTRT
jgi:hypothetical protein